MASQVTGVSIVFAAVCSGADRIKLQSSASLAFVRGIHRWPMNSPLEGPVTRKVFPFNYVIMIISSWQLRMRRILQPRSENYGLYTTTRDLWFWWFLSLKKRKGRIISANHSITLCVWIMLFIIILQSYCIIDVAKNTLYHFIRQIFRSKRLFWSFSADCSCMYVCSHITTCIILYFLSSQITI